MILGNILNIYNVVGFSRCIEEGSNNHAGEINGQIRYLLCTYLRFLIAEAQYLYWVSLWHTS